MPWLLWDIRGIHQKDSTNHLKELIKTHDVLLILFETKASHVELPRFAFIMGFSVWIHGTDINSHVWILWKGQLRMHTLFTSQAITVEMGLSDNCTVIISCVYVSCLIRIRREL